MKLIELLNKIANGEVKEGTKCIKDGKIDVYTKEYYTMLNEEVEIIEEKQQGRWKPKEREHYWFIDSCKEIYRCTWSDARLDNWRYATKNIFKTRQEAEEYLKYKTALFEAEKPFVKNEMNWLFAFSTISKELFLDGNFDAMGQGTIYLGQYRDVAKAFIDKWEKQILKYEFGIEE